MDYFAKFKKRIVPAKAQPTSAMQLAKFHKCWDYVHNIFVVEDRKVKVHVEQTDIPGKLRQMVDMLVDEEARQEDNTTGVCMEYFLKNGVLQYLVNVSEKADYPTGIRGEAIRTIASMVDLLNDCFLVHNAIHKPTVKLLRFCVLDEYQSDFYHEDLVDLMYIICSKIYGFPALLNIFFHDKQWLTTPQKTQTDANYKKPEYEFLLFTYLLRFVHREGRSGDFARTGLLFLMEMATNQLGDFILESDFATIMAAGLGALYSQLPRKLVIKDETELNSSLPSYLLGQDFDSRTIISGIGVVVSTSEEFKLVLDTFLKLLEFCQDVLIRCPNVEISVRLLQSIRTIFLENILYPTILECSDMDGSSVAVISYIDLILQALQQDELADVIVGFLMDEDDGDKTTSDVPVMQGPSKLLDGINFDHIKNAYYTAERFTLKDLIFSRLKSNSQPTVIATLKLLKTLIAKHCRYSLKLLSISPCDSQEGISKKSSITVSHHIREIELYSDLVSAIDDIHAEDILTTGYEEYLRDMEAFIESDWCYQNMNRIDTKVSRTPKSERRRSFKYAQRFDDVAREQQPVQNHCRALMFKHRIKPADALLQILLDLLSHFFAQSSELNLALTGVISALAICPYRSLEGWITFSESDRTTADDILVLNSNTMATRIEEDAEKICSEDIYAHFDCSAINEDDEDDDRSIDFGTERHSTRITAPTQFKSFPPFFTLFRTLTKQIDYYRSEVDGFDKVLEERWKGLLFGEADINVIPSASTSSRIMSPMPSSSTHRRPSMRPSTSSSTQNGQSKPQSFLVPPNPSKSLSSSTTAAAMAAAGSLVSLAAPSIISTTSTNNNPIMANPLSPIAMHARKTQSMRIQPLFPSTFIEQEEPIIDLDEDDETTFAPKTNPSQSRRMDKSTEITLSMLLNNVVILEEAIKELVAIMQTRRSLGIDEILYCTVKQP
ncbi:hypothetical protein DFQ28_001909 [Apophysomyces sp. BC1034]|nr:hypothetical protein DFQ30_002260 [Apophysomyces sp. BC1015]KAG0180024.1 hypothetical protein DFQ29_001328 [Apophysomyces sp. BC1021]KAG0190544.1 hypothetical protein DFQ28_001909 [Apophysomyces sp. BC1034]